MNKNIKQNKAIGPIKQAKIAAQTYIIMGKIIQKIKIRKYLRGINFINISSLYPPL